MTDDPASDRELSAQLREQLDGLDAAGLRAVRSYATRRLEALDPSLADRIEAEADGEIINVESHGTYALVRMYPPGGADHPVLFHVTQQRHVDGAESLHWTRLGDVRDNGGMD